VERFYYGFPERKECGDAHKQWQENWWIGAGWDRQQFWMQKITSRVQNWPERYRSKKRKNAAAAAAETLKSVKKNSYFRFAFNKIAAGTGLAETSSTRPKQSCMEFEIDQTYRSRDRTSETGRSFFIVDKLKTVSEMLHRMMQEPTNDLMFDCKAGTNLTIRAPLLSTALSLIWPDKPLYMLSLNKRCLGNNFIRCPYGSLQL